MQITSLPSPLPRSSCGTAPVPALPAPAAPAAPVAPATAMAAPPLPPTAAGLPALVALGTSPVAVTPALLDVATPLLPAALLLVVGAEEDPAEVACGALAAVGVVLRAGVADALALVPAAAGTAAGAALAGATMLGVVACASPAASPQPKAAQANQKTVLTPKAVRAAPRVCMYSIAPQ
jgi:hypothetical protein